MGNNCCFYSRRKKRFNDSSPPPPPPPNENEVDGGDAKEGADGAERTEINALTTCGLSNSQPTRNVLLSATTEELNNKEHILQGSHALSSCTHRVLPNTSDKIFQEGENNINNGQVNGMSADSACVSLESLKSISSMSLQQNLFTDGQGLQTIEPFSRQQSLVTSDLFLSCASLSNTLTSNTKNTCTVSNKNGYFSNGLLSSLAAPFLSTAAALSSHLPSPQRFLSLSNFNPEMSSENAFMSCCSFPVTPVSASRQQSQQQSLSRSTSQQISLPRTVSPTMSARNFAGESFATCLTSFGTLQKREERSSNSLGFVSCISFNDSRVIGSNDRGFTSSPSLIFANVQRVVSSCSSQGASQQSMEKFPFLRNAAMKGGEEYEERRGEEEGLNLYEDPFSTPPTEAKKTHYTPDVVSKGDITTSPVYRRNRQNNRSSLFSSLRPTTRANLLRSGSRSSSLPHDTWRREKKQQQQQGGGGGGGSSARNRLFLDKTGTAGAVVDNLMSGKLSGSLGGAVKRHSYNNNYNKSRFSSSSRDDFSALLASGSTQTPHVTSEKESKNKERRLSVDVHTTSTRTKRRCLPPSRNSITDYTYLSDSKIYGKNFTIGNNNNNNNNSRYHGNSGNNEGKVGSRSYIGGKKMETEKNVDKTKNTTEMRSDELVDDDDDDDDQPQLLSARDMSSSHGSKTTCRPTDKEEFFSST